MQNYNWILQTLYKQTRDIAKLEQTVNNLGDVVTKGFDAVQRKMDSQDARLTAINRMIWMTVGGSVVIGAIIGLLSMIGISQIARFLQTLTGP
jgi:hypothetical protein